MGNRTTYRASTLPRLAHCAAAAVTSEGCADDSVQAGVVGRAFHAVMAYAAEHGLDEAFKQVKVEAMARGVNPSDVEELLTRFKWDPSEVNGKAEVRLELVNDGRSYGSVVGEKLIITGTADLLVDHSEDHIEVIDYKTTRRFAEEADPAEHPQILAYGLAAWRERWGHTPPPGARCTVTLAFARLGSEHGWASYDFWESDLSWIEDMLWKIVAEAAEQYDHDEAGRDYQSGMWCQYCPGRAVCKALTADLQGALNLVGKKAESVTRKDVLDLHALRKSMTRFESALKKRVHKLVSEGGPIEKDGNVLEFRSSFRRPNLSMEDVTGALLRCGADPQTREAVTATLGMRAKVESERLDLYKRRE